MAGPQPKFAKINTRVFSLKTTIRLFSSNFFHPECHRVVTGGKISLQTISQTPTFKINERILSLRRKSNKAL